MKYNYKGREIEILNKDWNCKVKAEGRGLNDVTIRYYLSLGKKNMDELTDNEITNLIHQGVVRDIVNILGQEFYDSTEENEIAEV